MRKQYYNILFVLLASSHHLLFSKEYLLKWKNEKAFLHANENLKSLGGIKVLEKLTQKSLLTKIDIPFSEKSLFLSELRGRKDISYIVENKTLHAIGFIPSQFAQQGDRTQWALQKIKASQAWQRAGTKGSHSVILAVLDTGVDFKHESLSANMISGYDFKDNDDDPSDVTSILNPGHGTHCAGIAGATGLLSNGTSGISPDLSIMPVRFLGKNGSGEMDDAVQAIDYAVEHGAQVISASWGGEMSPLEAQPLLEAMKRANDAGVIFVTAAGNGDESGVGYNIDYLNIYPASANFENSITVAATDQNDFPTRFSNVGKRKVHLAAPGMNVLSTLPMNRYDELSGTSMSAPLVAGLVALLKSINPALKGSEVKALLQSSGQQIEIRNACQCRIDAEAAVSKVMDKDDFLIPDAATLKVGEALQFRSFFHGANLYLSSDENIASIDFKTGILKAKNSGKVKVSAQDEKGAFMTSHWIRIKAEGESEDDPEDSGSSSSDPYACPMQSPEECKQACIDHPGLPWCEISKTK